MTSRFTTSLLSAAVLTGADRATDVLGVGADIWVSAGNGIRIVSPTGVVKKTVTGILGATGLALSADHGTVYASSSTSSKIFRLSAAGAVLGSWTSQECPGKSAVVGGQIYYAYGCSGGTTGVARIDLSTGADASVLTSFDAGAVTAAGSTLVT